MASGREGEEIGLRDCYESGFQEKSLIESIKFLLEHGVLTLNIVRSDLNHKEEKARSLDMTEEAEAQPSSFMRPLNEAGNVGHHKTLVGTDVNDPEAGCECGEGIVSDLRVCSGEAGEKG